MSFDVRSISHYPLLNRHFLYMLQIDKKCVKTGLIYSKMGKETLLPTRGKRRRKVRGKKSDSPKSKLFKTAG